MSKPAFNELINADTPVLVDFYADWCGPCQSLAPVIKDVARDLKGKVKTIKIDTDKNQALAAQLGIRSIPTIILFRKGEVAWRYSGLLTRRELLEQVNYFVG